MSCPLAGITSPLTVWGQPIRVRQLLACLALMFEQEENEGGWEGGGGMTWLEIVVSKPWGESLLGARIHQ